MVTRRLANEAGREPAECVVTVNTQSAFGDWPRATVSLADCSIEAERLVGHCDPRIE
jgi:hypothetical protein